MVLHRCSTPQSEDDALKRIPNSLRGPRNEVVFNLSIGNNFISKVGCIPEQSPKVTTRAAVRKPLSRHFHSGATAFRGRFYRQ